MSDDLRTLEELRESGRQDPELVLRLGRDKVKKIRGEECYAVLEQVAIAAIECNDRAVSAHCLERLKKRFGHDKSPRLMLLYGLKAESLENWKEAEEIYEKILKLNSLHRASIKRLATIAYVQGDSVKAVNTLTDYLDQVYDDVEAWRQCSTLYTQMGLRSQATFCSEEVLLLEPKNVYNFLYHAELLYGQGQNLAEVALAYKTLLYCAEQGVVILRVWLGILLCTKRLRANDPDNSKMKKVELVAIQKIQAMSSNGIQNEVLTEWITNGVQ